MDSDAPISVMLTPAPSPTTEELPNEQSRTVPERDDSVNLTAEDSTQQNGSANINRYLVIAFLCLCLFVVYKSARFAWTGWTVYQDVTALRTGLQQEPSAADKSTKTELLTTEELQTHVGSITQGMDELDERMGFFAPLLGRLSWVPTYGPTLAQAPELLSAGSAGVRLANNSLAIVEPLWVDSENSALALSALADSIEIEALANILAESPEEIALLAEQALTVANLAQEIDATSLDPRAGPYVALTQPYLAYMPSLIEMAPYAETLLGMEGAKNYLVLVQNNHELRATGGFLTAVGHVVMDQGEIGEIDFVDSYKVSQVEAEHPPAPEPLRRYMGTQLLLLRDANWSPDLPTAAQMIKAIYAADTGIQIDGIVTLDLRAAELLVNALAPLEIEGADEPLTGETLLEQILDFWSKPLDTGDALGEVGLGRWWHQRKDFMPKLADAALSKVQSGNVDYPLIAEASLKALDERSIQLWIDEPGMSKHLAELQWDGGLNPREGSDFLALIDSNLGFNKVDYLLERSLSYSVEWPEDDAQPAEATTTVRYEHPATAVDDYICDITPRYGDTYEDSAARCYFNFVRLYVPSGSELVAIDGIEADTSVVQRGEDGLQIFAGYAVMKPGEVREITFRYRLPASLEADGYQLHIRRQAGSKPLSVIGEIGEHTFEHLISNGTFEWSVGH